MAWTSTEKSCRRRVVVSAQNIVLTRHAVSVVRDKLPHAAEPSKAGDAVVAPKQEGAQGFYKVWVSDAPIEAE